MKWENMVLDALEETKKYGDYYLNSGSDVCKEFTELFNKKYRTEFDETDPITLMEMSEILCFASSLPKGLIDIIVEDYRCFGLKE